MWLLTVSYNASVSSFLLAQAGKIVIVKSTVEVELSETERLLLFINLVHNREYFD